MHNAYKHSLPSEHVSGPKLMAKRSTEDVFPRTQNRKQGGALSTAEAADAVGAGTSRFVSERQLSQMKQGRGERPDDGTAPHDTPLYEVLQQQKRQQEDQRAEQERQMMQGSMKPLDEDDVDFINKSQALSDERAQLASAEDERELSEFRRARSTEQSQRNEELAAGPLAKSSSFASGASESDSGVPRLKRLAQKPPAVLTTKRRRHDADSWEQQRKVKEHENHQRESRAGEVLQKAEIRQDECSLSDAFKNKQDCAPASTQSDALVSLAALYSDESE